jgi:hypothetical protein
MGDVRLFAAHVAALDLAAWKRRLVKDFNRRRRSPTTSTF